MCLGIRSQELRAVATFLRLVTVSRGASFDLTSKDQQHRDLLRYQFNGDFKAFYKCMHFTV